MSRRTYQVRSAAVPAEFEAIRFEGIADTARFVRGRTGRMIQPWQGRALRRGRLVYIDGLLIEAV